MNTRIAPSRRAMNRPNGAFEDAMATTFGFKPPDGTKLARQDPAMGRGYRIGALRPVPAMSGLAPGIPPVLLANHSHIEVVTPFKVNLGVLDEDENDPGPRNGSSLRFFITSAVENDRFLRIVDVSLGNAATIYLAARAIRVEVTNEQDFALQATMGMDEWSPGVSTWQVKQVFVALAAEIEMDIPPFCQQFRVYTPTGSAAPRVRGYAAGGILVVDMVLLTPSSGDVERVPGLDYTIDSGGPVSNYAINYQCFG